MPSANAEIVRTIIDALNRGDVDGVLAGMHDDFEWTTLDHTPVAGTYRGREQVRDYVEDWLATFDELRLEIEDLHEAGDHVLVVVRGHGRGRASGITLDNHFCQVWTLRGGKAVRIEEKPTRGEGLEALGPS